MRYVTPCLNALSVAILKLRGVIMTWGLAILSIIIGIIYLYIHEKIGLVEAGEV